MTPVSAMSHLRTGVIDQMLCTGCGACINQCPYLGSYRDRIVIFHDCDQAEGGCIEACPRGMTDLAALRQILYNPADLTDELGAFKELLISRATDESIRRRAQHGGTVTALMALALEQGLIDTAVLASDKETLLPAGRGVTASGEAVTHAGSRFVVSPTLAAVNDLVRQDTGRLGVVATPCQALALAKMKTSGQPKFRAIADRVKLVIGLFCGWALDWRGLKRVLAEKVDIERITGLDIPPSQYQVLVVKTVDGELSVSLAEVTGAVRQSCQYCYDLTAEFSDLSVGSARLPEGWEEAKDWNQIIVRSETGAALLDQARRTGVLEFRPVPKGNIDRLKAAAISKKRTAAAKLAEKSGRSDDLIYFPATEVASREVPPRPVSSTENDQCTS